MTNLICTGFKIVTRLGWDNSKHTAMAVWDSSGLEKWAQTNKIWLRSFTFFMSYTLGQKRSTSTGSKGKVLGFQLTTKQQILGLLPKEK